MNCKICGTPYHHDMGADSWGYIQQCDCGDSSTDERAEMQAAIMELREAVRVADRFGRYDPLLNKTKKWSKPNDPIR